MRLIPARPVSTSPPAEPVAVERIPWSELGDEFAAIWGRPQGSDGRRHVQAEHVEIAGPTGSGKTYLEATMLRQRAERRDSGTVMVVTKQDDKTVGLMGWPVVDNWREVRRHRQVIYWPRTDKLGAERRAYHEHKVHDLLSRLWVPNSNNIVAFDEIAYLESLSARLKEMIGMYWREARSQGITVLAMKQRLAGVQRDMHSESVWTASFKLKDADDVARTAEVFGSRRAWIPILDSLNREKREFLIKHSLTDQAYISWIDKPLRPPAKRRSGYLEYS